MYVCVCVCVCARSFKAVQFEMYTVLLTYPLSKIDRYIDWDALCCIRDK